jgi:hypothetical protein
MRRVETPAVYLVCRSPDGVRRTDRAIIEDDANHMIIAGRDRFDEADER